MQLMRMRGISYIMSMVLKECYGYRIMTKGLLNQNKNNKDASFVPRPRQAFVVQKWEGHVDFIYVVIIIIG